MAKAKRNYKQCYSKGYLPKIMYWAEQLYNACEYNDGRDTDRIEKAKAKLDYFYTRQQRAIRDRQSNCFICRGKNIEKVRGNNQ